MIKFIYIQIFVSLSAIKNAYHSHLDHSFASRVLFVRSSDGKKSCVHCWQNSIVVPYRVSGRVWLAQGFVSASTNGHLQSATPRLTAEVAAQRNRNTAATTKFRENVTRNRTEITTSSLTSSRFKGFKAAPTWLRWCTIFHLESPYRRKTFLVKTTTRKGGTRRKTKQESS